MTAATALPVIPALPPLPSFSAGFTPSVSVGAPKSFLLYGDTGTRKTTMVGELVKTGRFNRALIFDIDNGTEVFSADSEIMAAVHDGRIQIQPIDSALDPDAFSKIDAMILEVCGAYRDVNDVIRPHPSIPDFEYDLVLLDTVNLAQTVAIKHFISTTFNSKGQPDTLAAWGKVGIWTDEIVRLLHNTTRFTAAMVMHPMTVEDKVGNVKVKPKLGGGMKDSISTISSLVVYLAYEKHPETAATSLVATLGESDLYDSKNRYRLPSKIYDFSLVDLYATIDGLKAAPAAPAPILPAVPTAPQPEPVAVAA